MERRAYAVGLAIGIVTLGLVFFFVVGLEPLGTN